MPQEQCGFTLSCSSLVMKPRSQPVSSECVSELPQLPHLLLALFFSELCWAGKNFAFCISESQPSTFFFSTPSFPSPLLCTERVLLISAPLLMCAVIGSCIYWAFPTVPIQHWPIYLSPPPSPPLSLSSLSLSLSWARAYSLSQLPVPPLCQGTNRVSSVVCSPSPQLSLCL